MKNKDTLTHFVNGDTGERIADIDELMWFTDSRTGERLQLKASSFMSLEELEEKLNTLGGML